MSNLNLNGRIERVASFDDAGYRIESSVESKKHFRACHIGSQIHGDRSNHSVRSFCALHGLIDRVTETLLQRREVDREGDCCVSRPSCISMTTIECRNRLSNQLGMPADAISLCLLMMQTLPVDPND